MGLPFEQQARESARAFEAFSEYLKLGPERSLAAVAQKLSKSEQLLKRWSARFDWPARVAAHAAHLALVERQATEAAVRDEAAEWLERRKEHRKEEWAVRGELLKAGREALRRWWANEKRSASFDGITRMLDLASRLGRLSSGMPTDHTEVSGEISATLDVEWEVALKRAYGGPKATGEVVEAEVVSESVPLVAPGKEKV